MNTYAGIRRLKNHMIFYKIQLKSNHLLGEIRIKRFVDSDGLQSHDLDYRDIVGIEIKLVF